MAYRACPTSGCPQLLAPGERCTQCRAAADRARRPTGNPYTSAGHRTFRAAVLRRDPTCVCPGDCGTTHNAACGQPSTIADHHPIERRDLLARGLNPDDPARGRGLCKACHDRKTGRTQPGGERGRL